MSEGVYLNARNQPDYSLKQAKTAAFGTAGIVVSAKPGRIFRVTTINAGATAYYLQIHNKVLPPVATDVPIWERRLAISGDLDFDFALAGLYVSLGFSVALSTTPGVLTLAAANDATVYALYTSAT